MVCLRHWCCRVSERDFLDYPTVHECTTHLTTFSDQVKIQAKLCFHFLVSMLPNFLYVSHTDISDILMMGHNWVFFLILFSSKFFSMWRASKRWWQGKADVDFTLSPSANVWPSLALFQEMSGRGSPSATQEIMAAPPSTAVTFFSWVIWGGTGGHRRWDRRGEEKKWIKIYMAVGTAAGNE